MVDIKMSYCYSICIVRNKREIQMYKNPILDNANPTAIHLIAKIGENLYKANNIKGDHTYISGTWAIDYEASKKLIGSKLYLHNTKNQKSANGGIIIDVRTAVRDAKTTEGVEFIFEMTREAKAGVAWGKEKTDTQEWIAVV